MLNGKNIAAVLAAGTLCSAAEIAPWDKYHIPEESRWRGEALPLPDPARDIMLFGSNVEWFMADGNGLGMIDEVRRLFPDTQFVLSAVFSPDPSPESARKRPSKSESAAPEAGNAEQ